MSSSTLGDSGGSVQQDTGGEFVDFSIDAAGPPLSLTTAAKTSDVIATGTGFTFTTKNANGTTTTKNVVGAAGGTVADLIAAINAANIPGVTASFTTAGAVGSSSGTVTAGDTGHSAHKYESQCNHRIGWCACRFGRRRNSHSPKRRGIGEQCSDYDD